MQQSFEGIGKSARDRCGAAVRALESYGADADARFAQLQKALAMLGASTQEVDAMASYWKERNAEWDAMEADCANWSRKISALESVKDGELKTAVIAARSAFASARAEWQSAIVRRGGVEGCRERAERVYQQLMRDAAATESRLLESAPIVGMDAIMSGFEGSVQWQAWLKQLSTWDLPSDLSAALGLHGNKSFRVEGVSGPGGGSFLHHIATGIELLPIAAGQFVMGSSDGAVDEKPMHTVSITRPFWMGKTEVTQAQYGAIVGNNPSHFSGGSDAARRPVERVLWADAVKFCEAMEKDAVVLDGVRYVFRLPTEAEWEYCCRAGTTTEWHTGSALGASQANFDATGLRTTAAVRGYEPNAWGLFDMHGNVWEWCLDAWDGSANYPSSAVSDPNVSSGPYRVVRGGSWNDFSNDCRSAFRYFRSPVFTGRYFGFRVCLAPVLVK